MGGRAPTYSYLEAWLKLIWQSSMEPGESHKEGQEDHGEVKNGRRIPLALLSLLGPPCLRSGSSVVSLELPQASFKKTLL